uniref:Nucleolar complex protein 2 homolog n=1 Tax=Ditylenchus dipsaci TaxID=166011 RepID=A0A915CN94_9BILA
MDSETPGPSKPILHTSDINSLLDLKTEYLLRKKAAVSKISATNGVNKTKSNILAITKQEKKAKSDMQEARKSRIKENEDLLLKEEEERIRREKILREKTAIYDRMSKGESELVYEDGTSAEFLVNFHEKKKELEEKAHLASIYPQANTASDSQQNELANPLIVHYDHTEEKGRVFGASHVPLSNMDEDERQRNIDEIKKLSEETAVNRAKRKKVLDARKTADRDRLNRIRARKGLPLLEPSDEEEEEQPETAVMPSLEDIPLPPPEDEPKKAVEKKKPRYGVREWDKEKVGYTSLRSLLTLAALEVCFLGLRVLEAMKVKQDKDVKKKKGFKDQVAELAEADPDFYEYLKAEEADIFNSSEDEPMRDDLEEDAEDNSENAAEEIADGSVSDGDEGETGISWQECSSGNSLLCFLCGTRQRKEIVQIEAPKYMAHSEKTFDELVRICFKNLGRCVLILLNPAEPKSNKRRTIDKVRRGPARRNLTKFKNWHKYSSLAKEYLVSVHTFLMELQSSEAMASAIRATVDLVDLYLHFPKLCKLLVKTLIQSWSRKAENVQVISFVALSKIVRFDSDLFVVVYKGCYKSYVANCKQVSAETLPLISFMQKSFTELTLLNDQIAYQYAFLYIRQFAIHLRNAMIAKRKDLIQTVYNWQFVQGLYLWVNVVCQGSKSPSASGYQWFKEVGYALVEIISILRKVFVSNKYLPLRIHCVKMLLQIQASCDVYIPTLSIAVELLNELSAIDEKKPESGKGTTNVVNIHEILRLSRPKSKMLVIATKSLRSLPIEAALKKFLKRCRSRDHVILFKSFYRKLLSEGKRSEQ